MKSIRLSVILCILLLLVLSLGGVSLIVYHMAETGLSAKNNQLRTLLVKKYEDRMRREREKLDEALLADAKKLSSMVRVQVRVPWREQMLSSLGILSAPALPDGYLAAPWWLAQGLPAPRRDFSSRQNLFYWMVRRKTGLKVQDLNLPPEQEGEITKYYQIDTRIGDRWRSPSMGEAAFAFDPKIFGNQLVEWLADTTRLGKTEVRRIRLKVSHFIVLPPRPFGRGPRRGDRNEGNGPPKRTEPNDERRDERPERPRPPVWTIYVQAAADTSALKEALAGHRRNLQRELTALEEDYEAGLANLRRNLIVINVGALLTALVLGCGLVHLGFRPLQRLSDAVSRISEKNIELGLDPATLPRELQPVAKRLNETLGMLRRAFAREKQAAADISHELRTPLAALMTTLDLGLRKERSAEEYREMLADCREAGRQMTTLVERLLALARLDAGSDHLRPRDVDVRRLAEQCVAMVRPLAEAKGLKLQLEADSEATVRADPDKLREVLTNLLHNAIEYNKPNGEVRVSVRRENGWLHIDVADTGIGIAPDAKELIFERFYRQDAARHVDARDVHAGIGLALVKGYIELMKGRIHVESAVGQGSTFYIELPAETKENEP